MYVCMYVCACVTLFPSGRLLVSGGQVAALGDGSLVAFEEDRTAPARRLHLLLSPPAAGPDTGRTHPGSGYRHVCMWEQSYTFRKGYLRLKRSEDIRLC